MFKKRYAKKAEYYRELAKKYRLKNPEKIKERNKVAKQKRRASANAAERERYAMKLGATPKLLTKENKLQITIIYEVARKTSLLSGFKCHVDHIVPLKGNNVCGLHVPWNLRITSQRYNNQKRNNLDESVLFAPSLSGGVLIHNSALPWNWSK